MIPIVNPKIEIIDYGPKMDLTNMGFPKLNPDQTISLAAKMTYKDKTAKEMAIEELEKAESLEEFNEQVKRDSYESIARGHASLTTSSYLVAIAKGTSKLIDSMLTGIKFGSFLMPSGRRIPITLENIIYPESLAKEPESLVGYLRCSEKNINFYKELIDKQITSKEEAAKIVQYGLSGGGFLVFPIESLYAYKQEFEDQKEFMPKEGLTIINKIIDQLKYTGQTISFSGKEISPRDSPSFPHPFTDPKKFDYLKLMRSVSGVPEEPTMKIILNPMNNYFSKKIEDIHKFKEEKFKDLSLIEKDSTELDYIIRDLVREWNESCLVEFLTSNSWRVWGEVKRHRTINQQVDSIYGATQKAINKFKEVKSNIDSGELNDEVIEDISKHFVIPSSLKQNNEYLKKWLSRISNSLDTYELMVNNGIPISDAIYIIPRGIKLTILKQVGLRDLIGDGFYSLRLCGNAEPEIRQTSEKERALVKNSKLKSLSELMVPKCGSGICPERKCCGRIKQFIPDYTPEFHEELHKKKFEKMKSLINKLNS
ncbi:MAG: FAD-dependent thymidylate synthase [Candidatus Nanoarchaeia archaeon]|nr:FAD-dependent thymidylate synthase [Candidatus Nanoarchaeia archaeon]